MKNQSLFIAACCACSASYPAWSTDKIDFRPRLTAIFRQIHDDSANQVWAFRGGDSGTPASIGRSIDPSYGLALGLHFTRKIDLTIRYSGLRFNGANSAQSPDPVINLLFPTIDEVPDRGTYYYYYENYFFEGQSDLSGDLETMDFMAGFDVGIGATDARVEIGVQHSKYTENLNASLASRGFDREHQFTSIKSQKYSGTGPKASLAAEFPIAKSPFYVRFKGDVAVLFGDREGAVDSTFTQGANQFFPAFGEGAVELMQTRSINQESHRVWFYGVEVGVGSIIKFGSSDKHHLKVEVTYALDRFDGLTDTLTRNERLGIPEYGERDDSLDLSGVNLSVELGF